MFKRISEFFKPKKTEPQISLILLEDLSEWLGTEEKKCVGNRSDQINQSRETIIKSAR